jgi:glycosyltransferase involved in cell wall biosynthesis
MGRKIENSDVLICSSQWSRQSIIDYGISPEKVKSLPFPLDLDLFNPDQRVYDSATRKKRLLWLGRLDPRKRLDLMIDAYRLLLKERQDVHLKIIGSFRHYAGYKALIDNFEFPEQIAYEPVIDRVDVPALLQQSDLLIQASEGENFGFSVAEALSCGLPVVVGPTNGTKDFISDSSFVFKEYTPESLRDSLVQALTAIDHNSQQLSQDARQAAERNFNIVNVVDEMEVLLRGDQTFERQLEEVQV